MDLSTLFAVRPTSNWTSTLQNATNATPLVKANAQVPQTQTASIGMTTGRMKIVFSVSMNAMGILYTAGGIAQWGAHFMGSMMRQIGMRLLIR